VAFCERALVEIECNMESTFAKNRAIVTAIIYGTLLLDNILLTVIGEL
jgi:hypothetical protein